jgi:hypothetical protein
MPSEPQYCPITEKYCHCTRRCDWYDRVNDYADAKIKQDKLDTDRGEQDLSTRGEILKPGT